MYWRIKGADEATGKEREIIVDAPSEEDAMVDLAQQGILIESIEKTDAPSDDTSDKTTFVPQYPEIVDGATALNTLANAAIWIAIILWVIAVVGLISIAGSEDWFEKLAASISAAIVGVCFFAAAAFMRMAGAVGKAIRDMATNSFKK